MAVPRYEGSRTTASSSPFAQPYTSPMGWNSPMGRSYKSGRGYWEPERMAERFQKAQLQRMEGSGPFGGGGGGGSRGGGGSGLMPPQTMMGKTPTIFRPDQVADQALVNFGNAPSLGQDYAQAQARVQTNQGGIGDIAFMQQRNNPSGTSDYNNAVARQKFRSMITGGYRPAGNLIAAAQRAFFV